MNILKTLLVMLMMVSFPSMAEPQDPFKLQTGQVGNYLVIRLTSVVDQVTVNNVIVNRGGCDRPSLGNPKSGTVIRFGQSKDWRWMVFNPNNGNSYPCEVLEIVVKTSEGDWTYTPRG
ncbi:hypothetical protein [Aeromonas phage AerS_266]|nr:hypothetical protein [Aeromonas phage AerS_266]